MGSEEIIVIPIPEDCTGDLHPMVIQGIEYFNSGSYWKAHEALEEAWLEETGQIRHLYRGILQTGVTYFHIEQCNYRGALKVYHRSQRWLRPFPDICRGINVGQLRKDLDNAIEEVRRLGSAHLAEIDHSFFKPVQYA
jgi:hypothetical protein